MIVILFHLFLVSAICHFGKVVLKDRTEILKIIIKEVVKATSLDGF